MSDTTPEDDAVLAGAEVEVPATDAPPAHHTTRTLADFDPEKSTKSAPLTTDPTAQNQDSIVNPNSS